MDNENYLNKENTKSLQGIATFFVLISHLPGYLGFLKGTLPGSMLAAIGSPAVGLFFFLSGFGLMESYKNKPNYLRKFMKKRIIPIYLKYIFFLFIYSLFDIIVDHIQINDILVSFSPLNNVVSNGWFIFVIIGFYFLYLIVFNIKKISDLNKVIIVFFGTVAYYLLCYFGRIGVEWYVSSPLFPVGLAYSLCRKQIDKTFNTISKNILLLSVAIILGLALLIAQKSNLIINSLNSFLLTITDVVFCICVIQFLKLIKMPKFLFIFIGKISLEVYLSQGLVFKFLIFIDINILVKVLILFIATIFIGYIINKMFLLISILYNKLLKSKNV